jgi:hypothetical protein
MQAPDAEHNKRNAFEINLARRVIPEWHFANRPVLLVVGAAVSD